MKTWPADPFFNRYRHAAPVDWAQHPEPNYRKLKAKRAPQLRTLRHCGCGGCGRYFDNVAEFDAHRIWDGEARECAQ